MGGDGDIRGRVGNASQDEALADLIVIQEGLVALVDTTGLNLTGARRAGTSAARVGEVNACGSGFKEKRDVNMIVDFV